MVPPIAYLAGGGSGIRGFLCVPIRARHRILGTLSLGRQTDERFSNEEVGLELGISPRTAKAHSDILRRKLGVPRRRQIPIAYRSLTGLDPLAGSLAPRG